MTKLEALELAAGLAGLVSGMEEDLMKNIAAFLLLNKAADKAGWDSARWRVRKLAELGKLTKKNLDTIKSYIPEQKAMTDIIADTMVTEALIPVETGFREAVKKGILNNAPAGSMEDTTAGILAMLRKQARDDLNLTNTTMLHKAKDAAAKVIRDADELANKQEFLDMLNKAAVKTVTAGEAYTSAVSQCLKDMAAKGIPGFVDKAGREWTPESYVNLCVRATAKNVESTALFERMKDYGTHFIEISSHLGARPKCAKDQGRIYDLNNGSGTITDVYGKEITYYPWSSTSYGKPDGILGINCGHFAYPFTPGGSIQRYFPYDQEENDKRYRQVQKQRELEREVRAAKRQCMVLQNGDKEQYQKATVRLKNRTARLKKYCKDNDLMYMNERTSVLGFGHSEAGKATAAYNRRLKESKEKLKNVVDKGGESGIIKGRGSGTGNSEFNSTYERLKSIDVSDAEQIKITLSEFEEKYRTSETEHCVVITERGIVYEVHGSKWTVDTTVLGEEMKGSINEHNHVTGESQYSFSKEDLFSSVEDGSKESMAFDEKYRYSMKFNKETTLEDAYVAYNSAVDNVMTRKMYGESINDEDEQHEIIKAACSSLGINYSRWLI